ncbi:hypothetical protein QDZ74_002499, partial [Pluralibacter gergoviae]
LVENLKDNNRNRYHINDGEIIQLSSGELIAISNQWSIDKINLLLNFVKDQGFVVEKVNK